VRPKKRILLIDNDEYRTSLRSFMLSTHAYRVIPAATADDAEALFGDVFPDMVLAAADFPGLGKLLQRLHERDAYVAQIVIADSGLYGQANRMGLAKFAEFISAQGRKFLVDSGRAHRETSRFLDEDPKQLAPGGR
jgi:DNA-binding NtrC family response regulator